MASAQNDPSTGDNSTTGPTPAFRKEQGKEHLRRRLGFLIVWKIFNYTR